MCQPAEAVFAEQLLPELFAASAGAVISIFGLVSSLGKNYMFSLYIILVSNRLVG